MVGAGDKSQVKSLWSKLRFEAKAQCLIDQFNNFTIKELDGMHVNGELTKVRLDVLKDNCSKGENIADNGGIKMAYRAYSGPFHAILMPTPQMPGLRSRGVRRACPAFRSPPTSCSGCPQHRSGAPS